MSGFIRTLNRAARRGKHHGGRGQFLGVKGNEDKSLIARLAREAKREIPF